MTLTCERCGDAVDTRDREGNGPCCHDLPQPWHRGEDGLYNRVTAPDAYFEDEDYSEEEEEEDERTMQPIDEDLCECDRSPARTGRDEWWPHRLDCPAVWR